MTPEARALMAALEAFADSQGRLADKAKELGEFLIANADRIADLG